MTNPSATRTVPVLAVSFDDIVDLFTLASPRLRWFPYPQHDLKFSCSSQAVWATTRCGPVPVDERIELQGKSWLLDLVVALARMHVNPGGCRIMISLEGANCAADMLPICRFEVGA